MAAAGARAFVSSTQTVGGGVGFLPERTRCPCSCAVSTVRSANWIQNREFRQRASASSSSSGVSLSKTGRGDIVSQVQDEGSSKSGSRVFKSMQDAAERRKESELAAAALASFDKADIARAISDAEYAATTSSSRGGRAGQPPRFATLRAFGQVGGEGVVTTKFEGTSVFELIAANIEASKQVKNWEVLSGRLAMLAISVALGVELCTGNSVFKGIDLQKLEAVAALCAIATLSAAGFAYAWRAKADVVVLMSKGYKNMVESAVDNLIDGLFFDEA